MKYRDCKADKRRDDNPEGLITYVTDCKDHDMRYAIDPTKIDNELGWLFETKFEDEIKNTIQWYLDNRKWWEIIINGGVPELLRENVWQTKKFRRSYGNIDVITLMKEW